MRSYLPKGILRLGGRPLNEDADVGEECAESVHREEQEALFRDKFEAAIHVVFSC